MRLRWVRRELGRTDRHSGWRTIVSIDGRVELAERLLVLSVTRCLNLKCAGTSTFGT